MLKIICFVIPLVLVVGISAEVYDDEKEAITEEEIKQEMGSASGRIALGCLGETSGFMLAIFAWSGSDDASQFHKNIILILLTTIGTGVGYLAGESIDNVKEPTKNVNYAKGRSIGAYLGGLSLFAVGMSAAITSAKKRSDMGLALMVLTPVEALGGSIIGYKIGKLYDRRTAINQIRERRHSQKKIEGKKSIVPDSGITLPLLSRRF